MKKVSISKIVVLTVIAASVIIGIYLYPLVPDTVASHWNAAGEVNGYLPKFWGLFLMPLVASVIFLLLTFVPRIDPLKANIEKFRPYFDGFIVLMTFFLLYVHTFAILWSFGIAFDMNRIMPPAFGALVFYLGILLGKAKRNWFIGVRTPWTLSSDAVWDKTHQLSGTLFKIAGPIVALGAFAGQYAFAFTLVPLISASLAGIVYSYILYRQSRSLRSAPKPH